MVSFVIRGFLFFIVLNGAIIFADGWARVVGIASTSVVVWSWVLGSSSLRGAMHLPEHMDDRRGAQRRKP
jgi:hypothetical protein